MHVKWWLAVIPLWVSACGFTPMYATPNRPALSVGVRIETSKDSVGQQLQTHLEDKLNPGGMPASPVYSLSVALVSSPTGMGVARDGTVSRYNVIMMSEYVLTRLADDKEIERGEIQHVSSYNNQVNQYFSTYISEKDALRRGMVELAELYRQRLAAYLLQEASL